ncbi:MAG TPA: RNA methyltransferase [Opitutaceae bacterium]|nr:RNA methyltransferase [Opitutaceae bacterium]
MNKNELVICGMAAVQTRFQRDAASIKRLFFDEPTARKIGHMCKALAAGRKVYRCVDTSELELISGTLHHGGIVAVVSAPQLRAPLESEVAQWASGRVPLLILDQVGNVHNLGALARTAAFFGVEHIILPFSPQAALPGEAAFRVAEGGLDHVTVWRVSYLDRFIRELVSVGYEVVGAATRGGKAETSNLPAERPVALVLGNEEQGLSPEVASVCSRLVTLSGSGRVESLNVSVAGAILLWEFLGRNRRGLSSPTTPR